ncbi:MAG: CAP domain-containing protein [Parachlamydia sp.]|nr:CAP domain-containing protein [Parachlamydia sp.]
MMQPKLLFILFFFVLSSFSVDAATKIDVDDMETRLIEQINAERSKQGLVILKMWKPLCKIARVHSENMAKKHVPFGHEGFDKRAHSLHVRYPLKSFGENVAYSLNVKDHLYTAVKGWMNSPPHRENILGKFEETGIGIAFAPDGSFYATQLFATRACPCD